MPGDLAAGGRGQVSRIESLGRPATPEDVWNAAVRAGVDPARMALSLCHVLGEGALPETDAGEEDEPVSVRYTLTTGERVQYDATLLNPFARLEYGPRPSRHDGSRAGRCDAVTAAPSRPEALPP